MDTEASKLDQFISKVEIGNSSESATQSAPQIKGRMDPFKPFTISGWVYDLSNFENRLDIEILENDTLWAVAKADLFREDLHAAGKGDGHYGFEIPVPPELLDEKEHRLRARIPQTGEYLAEECRFTLRFPSIKNPIECEVKGLDGRAIVGWGVNKASPNEPITVTLYEGKKRLATAVANQENFGRKCAFRLVLPDEYLDGRPHAFSVRDSKSGLLLGGTAEIVPAIATPYSVLQEFIPTGVKATLCPSAHFRYDALNRRLQELTEVEGSKKTINLASAKLLSTAHQQLVEGFERKKPGYAYPSLAFKKHDNPDVSLVIPVHNKFPVTYHCLASICLAPTKATYEIIVVDDGSQDDTLKLADIVSGIEIVRNEQAQGFVKASNAGAKKARGEYVVMLNNDTEVTPDWLDELVFAFKNFDDVGLVGAKLLYPNGTLQEAGGIVWGNGQPWNYGRNGNASDPKYNYIRQIDYISGACIMLPKTLWDALGGFDEHFAPAYYEDNDLAFRVRDNGLKTLLAPKSQVIHFEGMSSGTSLTSGTKRYQAINEPKFKSRWCDAYQNNGKVGIDPDLAKDRNINFRALVIDAETPQPDRDAGSYAAIQEMRLLQSLGFKLTFVPENMAFFGAYTETLEHMGIECSYAPFANSVHDLIEKRGREFDVFYITRFYVAQKYIQTIRKFAPEAKIVFNNADLHFLRELRAGIVNSKPELIQQAIKTRDQELACMRQVDVVLSYNEAEHAVIVSHNLDSTKVAKCPWVVELSETVNGFASRQDIAFLGGFSHLPNIEAVEFFIQEVMPLLERKSPDIRLLVYGSRVPEHIKALASETVIIKGYVETVAEVYETARVFIAPLKSGAGLKGKVAGALAYGIPSVLSPVAAEGIGLRDGLEARIVDSPADWADAITQLYHDEKTWAALSSASRAFAQKEFSFEGGRKLMGKALHQVGIFPPSSHKTLVYKKA